MKSGEMTNVTLNQTKPKCTRAERNKDNPPWALGENGMIPHKKRTTFLG